MDDKEFLTTAEVSQLLNINEKKVYVLAQEGIIPATKTTGKWLFPYQELINFLKYDSLRNIKKGLPFSLLDNNILLGAGSDDPLLSKIFSKFYTFSKTTLFYSTIGSIHGIDMLRNRIIHFAFSHLYDETENDFNIPYLKKYFLVDDYVVISLFFREVGIISNFKISEVNELKDRKPTFILRQKGSGIRNLTDLLFNSKKLEKTWFDFYSEEVDTHFDVARLVKEQSNFVGITSKSTSKIFDLNFLPLFEERFDLITLKEYFFSKPFQKFYEFITQKLPKEFSSIEGYNFSLTGKIFI